ncbi:hypothetical protein ElyMa_005407200 [Elysia marginata]|uniref:Uncharacterized protein n=1 Tax=Elysia marginata TaxID=1093978 RepID=A0AAV4EHZ0_9GAST|nr:hypothetical protein ElyMa_005407200 [Elysia marginata]
MRNGKIQRIIENLVHFPPGASNYLSCDKSRNLAHEADPDILPEMMLRIAAHDTFTGTLVKVKKWDGDLATTDLRQPLQRSYQLRGSNMQGLPSILGSVSNCYMIRDERDPRASSVDSTPLDMINNKSSMYLSAESLALIESDTLLDGRGFKVMKIKGHSFSKSEVKAKKEEEPVAERSSNKAITAAKAKTKTKVGAGYGSKKLKPSRASSSRSNQNKQKLFMTTQKPSRLEP